jgi:hypothetical protein
MFPEAPASSRSSVFSSCFCCALLFETSSTYRVQRLGFRSLFSEFRFIDLVGHIADVSVYVCIMYFV